MADLETLVSVDYVYNGQKANAANLNNPLEDLSSNIDILNNGKAPKDSPTFTGSVALPVNTLIDTYDVYKVRFLENITTDLNSELNLKAPIESPTFTGTVTASSFLGDLIGNASSSTYANKLKTPIKINDVPFDGSSDIYIEKRMANTIDSSSITNLAIQGYGDAVHVSGTSTITTLGQGVKGNVRTLIFNNILTLKNNIALILPGNEDVITNVGDVAVFICENSSSPFWRCVSYTPFAISVNELRYLDGLTGNIQSQLDSLNTASSQKADKSYVDAQLNLQADKASVTSSLAIKADKSYVDSELNKKANTIDVDTELSLKANIVSPTLLGIPRAPTPGITSNDNQIATTAFVNGKVSASRMSLNYGSNYTIGFTNMVSWSDSNNYFDVFPPSGKTMANLVAFIPSIMTIHFAGGVDGNDSIRCTYSYLTDRIRVYVQNTEQRSAPGANWLACWN